MIIHNFTKEFIQLNSISFYYGDNIYTVFDNKSTNFIGELAPESVNTRDISINATESNYTNITAIKAKAKSIEFGVAAKYTIGDSTKNHTLYKRDKYSVYSLLKNF